MSDKRLLSVEEAAAYIGRTPSALRTMIFRAKIPVVRHGRRVQLDRLDLDDWIEQGKAFTDEEDAA
jgi:excisionase family DNA binding protein